MGMRNHETHEFEDKRTGEIRYLTLDEAVMIDAREEGTLTIEVTATCFNDLIEAYDAIMKLKAVLGTNSRGEMPEDLDED